MLNRLLYYISNPFVVPLVFGAVVYLLAYLDAKINRINRPQKTYNKLLIISILGAYGILYLTKNREQFMRGGSNDLPHQSYINNNGNEVYTNAPNW